MNGVHDMGGMHGFGPIVAEPEATEPSFHADWERTVLAVMYALDRHGLWSVDRFRKTIESEPPTEYLGRSYYERWLAALETLLESHGVLTTAELAAGRANGPGGEGARAGQATERWSPRYETTSAPRFQVGQRVRARNRNPSGHTRQPRYVRGREGTIVRHCGAEPLPEEAAELRCVAQHLYCVRFEAAELWGPDAAGRDAVYLELWEEYLEPVP
jgi:nitrile hydratase